MRAISFALVFMVFLVPHIRAQVNCNNLTGYWMELDGKNYNSLSTLLVFDTNESGEIEGSVFFMKSENQHREFALSKIKVDETGLSFIIENTGISFNGKLDEKGLCFSGTFYLDGKTVSEAMHQKLDEQKVKKLCNPPEPRKIIDHNDGVMIG